MIPTRRAIGVALGLLLATVGSLLHPPLQPLVLGLDLLAGLAVLVDLLRTPAPRGARPRRVLPQRVGLSAPVPRTVELELGGAAGLEVELREAFPPAFEVVGAQLREDPSGGPERGRFAPSGRLRFTRTYRCHRRGRHTFGDLRVFVRGPWGLVERAARFEGPQDIAVEPALMGLRRTLELAASERWQDLGVRRLPRRGGRSEFESLREYVPGDDVRRIDWKAFARRGKPMVRQYQVERGQELILLIDCGRRMRAVAAAPGRGAAAAPWTKLDWALDAALQLAAVALSKGDRVGAGLYVGGLEAYVAPSRGPRQMERLSRMLFDRQPIARESDLGAVLEELCARHRRGATVLVLSDVADPLSIPAERRMLTARSRRHRIVFAALDDPDLRALAEGRPPVPPALRAAALDLVEDRRRALLQLATSGARVLDTLPAEAAAPLLAAWLEERTR